MPELKPKPQQAPNPSNQGLLSRAYNAVMPQEGIIPRMLGGVMSESMANRNPEVAKSWAGRQVEFPENAAKVNRIGEMGFLKRALTGGAYGSTSPFGTIELNMPAIKQDNQNIDDVLAHEMAHAGQGITGWLRGMYSDEPENKAINTEVFRKARREDIPLRRPAEESVDPTIKILEEYHKKFPRYQK